MNIRIIKSFSMLFVLMLSIVFVISAQGEQTSAESSMAKPFLSGQDKATQEEVLSEMSEKPMYLLAIANGITTIHGKSIALNSNNRPNTDTQSPTADVPVGVDPNLQENEPSIAAKPDNAKVVVAASHTLPGPECSAYRSLDGGMTWTSTNLPVKKSDDFCSDPVVRWAPDGSTVYAAYMSIRADFSTADIVVSKSLDKGATWKPPVVAISGSPGVIFPDKPWLDVHTAFNGPNVNKMVYVTSTRFTSVGNDIAFARSVNGASSFEPKKILASSSGPFAPVLQGSRPIGGKPTSGTMGNVLVCWYNSGTDGFINGSFSIKCKSSTDYGQNFGTGITAMDTSTFGNFEIPYWLGPFSQFHRWWGGMFPSITISSDGVARMVFTAAPVDNNANPGTGENGDIYYIESVAPPYDIWTGPFPMNTDALILTGPPGDNRSQGYPTITVKQTSSGPITVVAWEDHRNSPTAPIPGIECGFGGPGVDPGINCIYDTFYTKDLGSTNVKLDTIRSVSDYLFIGDYIDSSASKVQADARAHVIWTDRRTKTSEFDYEDNTYAGIVAPVP